MQLVDDLIVLDFLDWLRVRLMGEQERGRDIIDLLQSDGNNRFALEGYAETFLSNHSYYCQNFYFQTVLRSFTESKEFRETRLLCRDMKRAKKCAIAQTSRYVDTTPYWAPLENALCKCTSCPSTRKAFAEFCRNNASEWYRFKDVNPKTLSNNVRYYWENKNEKEEKFQKPFLKLMECAEIELSEELNFFDWMEKSSDEPTELRKMPYSIFEKYVNRYVDEMKQGQDVKNKLLKSFKRTGWEKILEKLTVLFGVKMRQSQTLTMTMNRYYSICGKYKCIILPLGDSVSQREYRSLISDHWDTLNDCSRDYLDIYYSEKDTGKTGFDIASRINSLPAHILNQPPCLVLWENSIKDAELVRIRNLHGDQIVELIRSIVDGIIADKNLQDIVSDARNKVEELKMENKGVERFFNISGNHNIVGDGNAVGNGIVNGNQNTVTGNVIQMGVSEEVSSLVKEFDSFIDSLNGIAGIDENIKKQVIEIMNQAKEGVAEQSEEKKSAAKKAFDLVKPFLNYVPKVLALLANSAQIAAFFGLGA